MSNKPKRKAELNRAPSQPKMEAKFYNGPTVAKDAKAVAKQGAQQLQVKSQQLTRRAKRHPFALLSLISALPTFLLLSLLSTVVCPPPAASPSFVQRLNPFAAKHAYSELQQTLCYPSNLYYQNVLEPHVYPRVDALKETLVSHPVYKGQVEPRLAQGQALAQRIYQGPIKPVIRRTSNGARKFYLTLIEPHLPFLHAQYQTATAPVKHHAQVNYKRYAAPHVQTASAYAKLGYAKLREWVATLLGHPLTHKAKKHAVGGFHLSRRASADAYVKSKPYAVKAGTRTERFMRETVAPRALVGTRWSLVQAEKGWEVISSNVALFYRLNIRPYVAPYLEAVEPYTSKVHKAVHPYVAPYTAKLFPEPQGKGFLTGWFDRVVSAQQKQFEQDLKTVKKPQNVPVPDAHHLKTGATAAKPSTKEEKKEMKDGREEVTRVREAIKLRVDKAGRSAIEDFEAELESSYADAVEKFPQWRINHRQTLARERGDVLKALDKLFTKSSTVNKDMIPKIKSQALTKFAKSLKIARDELKEFQFKVEQRELPLLQQKQEGVQAALGPEYEQLKASMAYLDGVSAKDWNAFNALRKDADHYSRKLAGVFDGTVKSPVDRHRKVLKLAYPEASTELDDTFEEFKHQVDVVCKAAVAKHEAKEELAKLDTPESRVSILPVAEAVAGAAGAGAIIGKGKQQVLDALSQANEVMASASSAAESVSILPVGVAASAAGSAIGKGKQQVVDALAAANEAVYGSLPTGASGAAYVKSVANDAAASAASAYDAAVSGASEAIIGKAEPTGYLKSVGNDAAAAASSAYNAAISNAAAVAHDASRTVVSAVGGTPAPDTPIEHVQSVAAVAAGEFAAMTDGIKNALGAAPTPLASSASAYLASATVAGADAYATGSSLLASLLAEASASYHSGTRELSKAAGATPTPETPSEYVESVAAAAAEVAAEATASVKSALGRDEL